MLPSVYPASEDGEERVRCIFKENSITALHDHCFVAPENLEDYCEFLCLGCDWTGYEGLGSPTSTW